MIFMTENPKVRIEKCEAPQQSNGYNCGLYVLLFADALSKDNNECINSHDTKGTEYNQQSLTHIFSGVNSSATAASNLRCEILQRLLSHIEPSYDASKVLLHAHIIPCLSLHHGNEMFPGLPNIHLCGVNVRSIDFVRLGVNCEDKLANIVNNLRSGDAAAKLVLQGNVILVITSFKKINNNNNNNVSLVMKSIIQHDGVPMYHATPLTDEILNKAFAWLRGKKWVLAQEKEEEKFESIVKGLELFLTKLNEVIPLQKPSTEIMKASDIMLEVYAFIEDHDWGFDESDEVAALLEDIKYGFGYVGDILCDAELGTVKRFDHDAAFYECMCYKARHFLNRNVAQQTGVVAHCVDGIHRLTSLECVLNGYKNEDQNEDENENCSTYHNTLPHSKMEINTMVILLTENHTRREEAFISEMKNLSSRTQQNFGCLQKLGKKEFFRRMIELLDKDCSGNFDTGNIDTIMDKIMDQIFNTLRSVEASAYYTLVPSLMLYDFNLNAEHLKINSNYVLGTMKTFTAFSIMRKFGTLYHSSRYQLHTLENTESINAELFELILILIWSRLSKDTYTQVLKFFINDSSMQQISTSTDQLVNEWLTSMIINVFSFVYYSGKVIWREMTDQYKRNKTKYNLNKLDVYRPQLLKGIESCTLLFSTWGPNRVLPSWFDNVFSKRIGNPTYLLEQYNIIIEAKGLHELDDSVARKKDNIEEIIITGQWMTILNLYSFVTVAYSQYLENLQETCVNAYSLEYYCESKIEQELNTDQFLSDITQIFLENFVPKPTKPNYSDDEEVLLKIPTTTMYGSTENIVTQFKDIRFINHLKQRRKCAGGHLEKAQIDRLITLTKTVDQLLFSKIYAMEINNNK